MTKHEKIMYGLIGFVIIVLFILLYNMFKPGVKHNDDEISKQLIQAQREIIELKTKENIQMDSVIRAGKYSDSMLNVHFIENQKNYKSLYEKLKNIPVNIARIYNNDDSIRIKFSEP
jgi:hypothetical protein